jgi:hypothetical protein
MNKFSNSIITLGGLLFIDNFIGIKKIDSGIVAYIKGPVKTNDHILYIM